MAITYIPKSIRSETANRITANVLRMINLQPNCVGYRVNNTGIWDEKKKLFRTANTQKGLPDIFACIRGRFVGIEVKAKGDRQSNDQKIIEQEIKAAKGVYLLTHSTDEFQIQLTTLLNG